MSKCVGYVWKNLLTNSAPSVSTENVASVSIGMTVMIKHTFQNIDPIDVVLLHQGLERVELASIPNFVFCSDSILVEMGSVLY